MSAGAVRAGAMGAVVQADGVEVTLGGTPVLAGFDLHLQAGEVRALVGLNGAGKTTALRVLLGMLRSDAGRVTVLGEDVWTGSRRVWAQVGHLVESPAVYPELTARENIALAGALHDADPREAAGRVETLATALGLASHLDTRVRRLSLGTRQKVGLVCALSHSPRVAVLDEPTNGLDPLAVVAFRDVVREIAEDGCAVLLTSHHFDELARVADRVDILHHGRVLDTLVPDGGDLEATFFARIVAAERSQRDGRPAEELTCP